ncbi:ATP synthase subunit gamma, mitochondrial, partial [Gryllus bimaculatus]
MSTVKMISLRVKSMKNIQKIVKTMKVVSVAKYAKAKKDLLVARPYGTSTKVFYDKLDLKDPQEQTLLIAITSDRGLCGALHKNVSTKIKEEFAKRPENSKIVCVGAKSRSLLQGQYGKSFLGVADQIGRKPPTFLDASRISNILFTTPYKYTSGKIIFNESKSVVSYLTSVVSVFTLRTLNAAPGLRVYDSLDDDLLQSYVEFSVTSLVFYALKEGAASEQSSRVNAMDQASKTAGNMINELTMVLNKTRQAAITTELIEIISGATAAKKDS